MMECTLRRVVLMLVVIAARQQQVEALEIKDLARGFINRYTSSNGFDQLNALVTSPFAAELRSADSVFKDIEEFLGKPDSKKAKNKELLEAAEQFVQLKRRRGEQVCEVDVLKATFELQANLNSGLPKTFLLNGPSNTDRRQLLAIFRQVGRENARFCLDRYQRQWAALIKATDWSGEERRIGTQLMIFQEETNELSCEHQFESVRPTVHYLECTLLSANETFNHPDDVYDFRQTLERIQLLRDDSQKALTQFDAETASIKPKSEDEIEALVGAYLHEPCDKLKQNEAVVRVLRGVELFARMFGLPDDLFLQYNAITDHLLKWTGRLVLCERLLDNTDIQELARALAQSARV